LEEETVFEGNLKERRNKNKLSMKWNTETNEPRKKNRPSSDRNEFGFYTNEFHNTGIGPAGRVLRINEKR
jgi:hypothetical protein